MRADGVVDGDGVVVGVVAVSYTVVVGLSGLCRCLSSWFHDGHVADRVRHLLPLMLHRRAPHAGHLARVNASLELMPDALDWGIGLRISDSRYPQSTSTFAIRIRTNILV